MRAGLRGSGAREHGMIARAKRAGAILLALALAMGVVLALTKPTAQEDATGYMLGTDTMLTAGDEGEGGDAVSAAVRVPGGKQPSKGSVAGLILAGKTEEALSEAGCSPVRFDGFDAEKSVVLPKGFEDEVLYLPADAVVLVDSDACVVALSCSGASKAVFSQVRRELQAKGWQFVESGADNGGSFFKEGGEYQWVFAMCYQIGEKTSVVMQYR